MLKVSENIVLKSLDEHLILCIQSKGDYDYREILQVENNGKIWCCINTDKFIVVESEVITVIEQSQTFVIIKTCEGEYKLPIMRERGIFIANPEVVLPQESPIEVWKYDFSGKSLNTKVSAGLVGASTVVVIGKDLVARNTNHIMEMYGDSSTAIASITPPQYSLVQKLGEVEISVYSSGEISFKGSEQEVRIKYSKPPITIAQVESNLTKNSPVAKIDFSKLKLKTLSKFMTDRIYLCLKTGSFSIVTDSSRKSVETDLVMPNPLTLVILSGDFKYLTGEISVIPYPLNTKVVYILRSVDKEKTVYMMVNPTLQELSW